MSVSVSEKEISQIIGELHWAIIVLKKQLLEANRVIEALQKNVEDSKPLGQGDQETHGDPNKDS